MFLGKRLDMRNLTEQKGAIYKRSVPGKKTDAAVAVLIDNSGSMNGERLEISKLAALCLYDFARKPRSPFVSMDIAQMGGSIPTWKRKSCT